MKKTNAILSAVADIFQDQTLADIWNPFLEEVVDEFECYSRRVKAEILLALVAENAMGNPIAAMTGINVLTNGDKFIFLRNVLKTYAKCTNPEKIVDEDIKIEELDKIPAGENVFLHDSFNTGRDISQELDHRLNLEHRVLVMSNGMDESKSFRIVDENTGRRWIITLPQ